MPENIPEILSQFLVGIDSLIGDYQAQSIEEVKLKIKGFIAQANANTKREDTNLKNALDAVIANYGLDRFKSLINDSINTVSAKDLEGVTEIRNSMFQYSKITSITIPDCVRNIGYAAFYKCENLVSVKLPECENFYHIQSSTFSNCTSLTSIIIPQYVTHIGNQAFYNCTAMEYYDFTACTSVPKLMASDIFANIPSECEIRVPTGLYDAWKTATNWSIYADNIVAVSGEHSHYYTSVVTEPTCTEQGYTTHTCIRCGDSYVSDYTNALGHDYETVVTEPTTKEQGYTTYTCKRCGDTYVSDYIDPIPFSEGLAYYMYDTYCSVKGIGECTDTAVYIPDIYEGLPVISTYMNAFLGHSSIVSVVLPETFTSFGEGSFRGCENLRSIVMPEGVISIGKLVFYNCTSLTNVTIPGSVTSIGQNAFYNCTSLTSITIPKSVTSIGSGAFSGCTAMQYYDFTAYASVPTLESTHGFYNIPSTCEIRVPASLYNEWIAATNWSTYADNIVAAEV